MNRWHLAMRNHNLLRCKLIKVNSQELNVFILANALKSDGNVCILLKSFFWKNYCNIYIYIYISSHEHTESEVINGAARIEGRDLGVAKTNAPLSRTRRIQQLNPGSYWVVVEKCKQPMLNVQVYRKIKLSNNSDFGTIEDQDQALNKNTLWPVM